MSRTAMLAMALLAATSAIGGCVGGYSVESPHPSIVHTISLPIGQSEEFRRGLEFELTEHLGKMIERRTPYKLADRNTADSELKVTIRDLTESVMTEDDRDNASEIEVSLYVEYEWKDLRSGQVLRSGTPRQSWYYAPAEYQTLRSAQTVAMRRLAERIVEDMEKPW